MSIALVTGLAGQDGSYLGERLTAEGHQVHGLVLDQDSARRVTASLPAATVHLADLADSAAIIDLIGRIRPDEIYNLGGISSVGLAWSEPLATGQISGLGAAAVCEGAWRLTQATGQPVRVLQASSSEIFGAPATSPQDERTPIAPVNPYGAAKAYAHFIAQSYRARGLFAATCILFNHESPRRPETFVTRKITSAVARIAKHGGELRLGNLDARRDWGWAPDYVDAMVRAIRHDQPDDFVVATGQSHSVADFVAAAFAQVRIDDWRRLVTLDPALLRPADAPVLVGSPRKAERDLGWRRTLSFEQLVARMVDFDLAVAG
ncbi:MAG: GDP-mannose 4,6-dehydratase [Bifidobacteriaceae bacterium]|nr:GDP-mannose 4,6-dehydratase [Bifidobacteriaceae bacterium]